MKASIPLSLDIQKRIFQLLLTGIFMLGAASYTYGQIVVRIPDQEVEVRCIKHIGRDIWVGTKAGLYRVAGNTFRKIAENNLDVLEIRDLDGEVWVITVASYTGIEGRGMIPGAAYRVDGDVLHPFTDKDVIVRDIKKIGGSTWISADNGIYRVDGDKVNKIMGRNISNNYPNQDTIRDEAIKILTESKYLLGSFTIYDVNGEAWVQSEDNIYRIEGNTPRPLHQGHLIVPDEKEVVRGAVWIATDKGVYRIEGNTTLKILDGNYGYCRIKIINGQSWLIAGNRIYRIVDEEAQGVFEYKSDITHLPSGSIWSFNNEMWVNTEDGLYRIRDNKGEKPFPENLNVRNVELVAGQLWLESPEGLYRFNGDTLQHIISGDASFARIVENNGQVWVGMGDDLYRVAGERAIKIDSVNSYINSLSVIGREVWVVTADGAYWIEGDAAHQFPNPDLDFYGLDNIDEQAWIRTSKGAYRIDKGTSIQVVPVNEDSWWKMLLTWIIPKNVWIAGTIKPEVSYKNNISGKDPYEAAFPRQFGVILETEKEKRDKAIQNKEYVSPERVERTLSNGRRIMYVAVRDKWGNTFEYEISGWVIPSAVALSISLVIIWLILVASIVVAAPFNEFSHSLLMNPLLRSYGSFGLLPLSLTILPPVRRHIFRRYLRGIQEDRSFSDYQKWFVVPSESFSAANFSKKLKKYHNILLVGPSGIGKTSFLKYLLTSYLQKDSDEVLPKGLIPVLLPLIRYQGEKSENIVFAQLANYGRLTDNDLNSWFLKQGEFLFFIDGLNEVDDVVRHDINRFLDQHWKANFFCLSSQEAYPEFSWVEKIEMASLAPEKVREVLYNRFGKAKAEGVINELTSHSYEIYKIPQDLEFAIELMEQGRPLPHSRLTLYEETLAPILESWVQNGRQDYPELLYHRAYLMLCARDAFFEQTDTPLPQEIRFRLLEKRFLVRRGDQYLFRHDLIRAYLAAKHFAPRWLNLLADILSIDTNWRPMLEFVFLEIQTPSEARDLLYAVLKRNQRLAGSLFNWLCHTRTEICKSWSDDFKRSYGEAMLTLD